MNTKKPISEPENPGTVSILFGVRRVLNGSPQPELLVSGQYFMLGFQVLSTRVSRLFFDERRHTGPFVVWESYSLRFFAFHSAAGARGAHPRSPLIANSACPELRRSARADSRLPQTAFTETRSLIAEAIAGVIDIHLAVLVVRGLCIGSGRLFESSILRLRCCGLAESPSFIARAMR